MIVNIPVSLGELLDKISILQIKQKKITNEHKQNLIISELKLLEDILNKFLGGNKEIIVYLNKLLIVNLKLWNVEDELRQHEKKKIFDDKFIELSRSVYINNDERSGIKLQINKKFGSKIIEIKSYEDYLF